MAAPIVHVNFIKKLANLLFAEELSSDSSDEELELLAEKCVAAYLALRPQNIVKIEGFVRIASDCEPRVVRLLYHLKLGPLV